MELTMEEMGQVIAGIGSDQAYSDILQALGDSPRQEENTGDSDSPG